MSLSAHRFVPKSSDFLKWKEKLREMLAQTDVRRNQIFFGGVSLFRPHMALREKNIFCLSYGLEAVMQLPHLRSRGSDIRGFHNDTCAHFMGVTGWRGSERVLVVGRRPAVGVVADERGGVSCARHPEVGLAWTDEGRHARKRTRGNPEN